MASCHYGGKYHDKGEVLAELVPLHSDYDSLV